jgi:hypothetical protein
MATTWAGTALNQGITRTAMNDFWNLNTNGNYPWCDGCTLPADSLQLITKDYFTNNYYYNTSVGIYLIDTAKTSLQILVKNDIGVKIDLLTTTGACNWGSFVATVYLNPTLTLAYTNAAQTTLYNGGGTQRATLDIAYPSATITRLTISAAGVVSGITYDYC